MHNYSVKVVNANAEADQLLLGVRLGRFCIANEMSVYHVAMALNVSKSVVYRWFTGKHDVGKHLKPIVEEYLRTLQKSSGAVNTNKPCPDLIS